MLLTTASDRSLSPSLEPATKPAMLKHKRALYGELIIE